MREEIMQKFQEALKSHPNLDRVYDGIQEHAANILDTDYIFALYVNGKARIGYAHGIPITENDLGKYYCGKEKLLEIMDFVTNKERPYITRNREKEANQEKNLPVTLITPLIFHGECVGVLVLGRGTPATNITATGPQKGFTGNDLELAHFLAEELMLAVEEKISAQEMIQRKSRQARQDKRLAMTLQNILLPPRSPKNKNLKIATLYRTARDEAGIGGDFYDVFEIGNSDKVGILIGDVVGHGINAARITALVKYTIRAFALEGNTPTEIIRRANQVITPQIESNELITLLFGVYDAKEKHFTYASAGHYFPIFVSTTGRTYAPLERLCSPPIGIANITGINEIGQYREIVQEFGDDDIFVFYTDGVIEARNQNDRNSLYGQDRLREVVAKYVHETPRVVLGEVQRDLISFSGVKLSDDAALMAIKLKRKKSPTSSSVKPDPRALGYVKDHVILRAQSSRVNAARDFVINIAEAVGFKETDIFGVRVAVGEALINAVEHGSQAGGKGSAETSVDVIGEWDPKRQVLRVSVVDGGHVDAAELEKIMKTCKQKLAGVHKNISTEPELDIRGRGLVLMDEFMDSVEFSRDGSQRLTVIMEKKLRQA